MKTCSCCKLEKPLDGFYKNKALRDGLSNNCRPCQLEANKSWRSRNTERHRQMARDWYIENRERDLQKGKDYYRNNKEKVLERTSQWKAENAEQYKESNKIWRKANPSKVAEYERRYIENNREKVNAKAAARRATKLQSTIKLSPEHEQAIKRLYAFANYISEKTKIQHHVDHIVPLQGKEMMGLHVPWNLQVIAASRNLAKGNKIDYEKALPACLERNFHG